MASPIRSFLNLLAFAAVAGVMLWREHVWQVRTHSAPGPAAVPTSATAPGGGYDNAAPEQETALKAQNSVLEKKLVEAEAKLSTLTAEVQSLKEAARPVPTPPDLARQFQKQRGLALIPEPVWQAAPLEQIMERIRESVEAGISVAAADARSRAAVAMGFTAAPFDYRAAAVSLAQMANGGFFEAGANRFLFREEASLARADGRELFIGGLAPILTSQKAVQPAWLTDSPNDDEALARRSLIHGDANSARVRFSLDDQLNLNFGNSGAPSLPPPNYSAPVYLAEIWKFSQDKGSVFIETLAGRGGPAALEAAYVRPPRSSAEVLHPELLYLAQPPFQPVAVDLGGLTIAGRSPYFTNTAGEFGTYIALRSWLSVDEAATGSEGWAGDRYAVWPGGAGQGDHTLWITHWRSAAEAREFFDTMRQVLMQRFSLPWRKVMDEIPGQFRVDDPHRLIRLHLPPESLTVVLTNATDADFAAALEKGPGRPRP